MPQTAWTTGLIGGLMVGLAGVILLVEIGKIMGASGILGKLVDGSGLADLGERAAIVAALIGAPAIAAVVWRARHERDPACRF